MERDCRVSYNDFDDSLSVSCREEQENIKSNFMIDRFIFSLTGKGKIVALQIRNASEVLAESNIDSSILDNLSSAKIIILKRENCLFIGLKLASTNQIVNLPLRVFLPQIKAN